MPTFNLRSRQDLGSDLSSDNRVALDALESLLVGRRSDGIILVDVSDPDALSLVGHYSGVTTGSDSANLPDVAIDAARNLAFINRRGPGLSEGTIVALSYDTGGAISEVGEVTDPNLDEPSFMAVDEDRELLFVGVYMGAGTARLTVIDIAVAGSMNVIASVEAITSTNFDTVAIAYDKASEIVVLAQEDPPEVAIIDVSDKLSPSVQGTVSSTLIVIQDVAVDTNRQHALLVRSTAYEVVSYEDPTSPTLKGSGTGSTPMLGVTMDERRKLAYGGRQDETTIIDYADPDAPAVADTFEDTVEGAVGCHNPALISEGTVLVGIDQGDDGNTWAFSANVGGPQKPTVFIERTFATAVVLTSSVYEHAGGLEHDASRWQVDADGGDFSSPIYDSGWDTDALREDLASGLTAETKYIARVGHRDTAGQVRFSAAKSFETVVGTAVGPRIVLFGERSGNRLIQFGKVHNDLGSDILAELRTNAIAPAGPAGECVFHNAYLVVEPDTEVELTVAPVVDGSVLEDARRTFKVLPTGGQTQRLEVSLTRPHKNTSGAELFRYGPRGAWFALDITMRDTAGTGLPAALSGVELEYEVVVESAEAV